MTKLPYVSNFRELLVYQKARALAKRIFEVSQTFPPEEQYSLTDQVRRSSRSVGAQIAEAWGKRRYERHFISKLTDADAEQLETQHWIGIAYDCGYLDEELAKSLRADCRELGRLLAGTMSKAHVFCNSPNNTLKEPGPIYDTNDAITALIAPPATDL